MNNIIGFLCNAAEASGEDYAKYGMNFSRSPTLDSRKMSSTDQWPAGKRAPGQVAVNTGNGQFKQTRSWDWRAAYMHKLSVNCSNFPFVTHHR